MDRDETRPPHRHFRNRMTETGMSRHRPKVCLVAIKAARQYREALDAANEARRALIAATVRRAPDARAALAALNHLADSFQLPLFADEELLDGEQGEE
jgi:hypothetical protein